MEDTHQPLTEEKKEKILSNLENSFLYALPPFEDDDKEINFIPKYIIDFTRNFFLNKIPFQREQKSREENSEYLQTFFPPNDLTLGVKTLSEKNLALAISHLNKNHVLYGIIPEGGSNIRGRHQWYRIIDKKTGVFLPGLFLISSSGAYYYPDK